MMKRMIVRCVDIGLLVLVFLRPSCSKTPENSGSSTKKEPSVEKRAEIPTICVYTLGVVRNSMQDDMMDSLKAHYPKCRYVANIALPENARTKKRNDHVRYRADLLNNVLLGYKTDSTIVIGLTQADIGLDNFRGQPHWGIMGMASSINGGVAVISSYRPHNRAELFGVMLHEIGHAQGLNHCPDTSCMMQNAKGGNPFRRTHVFCNECKAYLQKLNWKL